LLAVTSDRPKQQNKFELSYRKPRIHPGERDGEIRIIFRAYGMFPVSLFHGARAFLTVCAGGADTLVPGTLFEVQKESARGLRYEFEFRADHIEALHGVCFHGLNNFSNIRSVRFELPDATRHARNPFFREPS
jgi:hypothetical protein